MAIYTRTGYGVLDTKALDAKTYYNSLAEYTADPYKYNGQIAYIKDAVEYYPDDLSEERAYSDSLRLNLPESKYLDFFYIGTSVNNPTGINIYPAYSNSNDTNISLNFAPGINANDSIRFYNHSGVPYMQFYDIDNCSITISTTSIWGHSNIDETLCFEMAHGLAIGIGARGSYDSTIADLSSALIVGNDNTISSPDNQRAMIGTGLIGNGENSVTIGQYNDATDPVLFSVGCGTSNSNRKNALTVNQSGCTTIYDLTVNSMAVNNGAVLNNIIDLDFLNKNIGITLDGTDILQSSSASPDDLHLMYTTYITGFKLRLTQAYKSTAKLNIFMYTNTTTKTPTEYILQNYPLGDLSVGDVAIEDLLIIGSIGSYIGFSITGADSTGKADGLLQYCQAW